MFQIKHLRFFSPAVSQGAKEQISPLLSLPTDVLLIILAFLTPRELFQAFLVCSRLAKLADNKHLWKLLYDNLGISEIGFIIHEKDTSYKLPCLRYFFSTPTLASIKEIQHQLRERKENKLLQTADKLGSVVGKYTIKNELELRLLKKIRTLIVLNDTPALAKEISSVANTAIGFEVLARYTGWANLLPTTLDKQIVTKISQIIKATVNQYSEKRLPLRALLLFLCAIMAVAHANDALFTKLLGLLDEDEKQAYKIHLDAINSEQKLYKKNKYNPANQPSYKELWDNMGRIRYKHLQHYLGCGERFLIGQLFSVVILLDNVAAFMQLTFHPTILPYQNAQIICLAFVCSNEIAKEIFGSWFNNFSSRVSPVFGSLAIRTVILSKNIEITDKIFFLITFFNLTKSELCFQPEFYNYIIQDFAKHEQEFAKHPGTKKLKPLVQSFLEDLAKQSEQTVNNKYMNFIPKATL